MMVALLQDGETIGSWILDPLSGRLAIAEKGGGAWVDGERIRTSPEPIALDQLEGIISRAFIPRDELGLADKLTQSVRMVHPTARCAGHEYPLVATGLRHFALYWRTLVWDHAPGALVLIEAGGSAVHLDGTPYRPTRQTAGLLVTHNPLIARALLDVVEPKI
jgi:fructose-1,6-bisphosphatase/inositol monophosphatase family enzyme